MASKNLMKFKFIKFFGTHPILTFLLIFDNRKSTQPLIKFIPIFFGILKKFLLLYKHPSAEKNSEYSTVRLKQILLA